MKWPFIRTKVHPDDRVITDSIASIEASKRNQALISQIDDRMEQSLNKSDKRIERNHFAEDLLPAWTLKEPKHGLAG